MDVMYDQKEGKFVVEGIKIVNQADNDQQVLMECCESLNETISYFAKQNDNNKQSQLTLQDAISRGIQAINSIEKSLIIRNQLNIAELKRDFKTALIQKKYNIDINEMSPDINKIFREDEKWWKRIKIGGSHLFSTKATLKGKINALFREFVNSDGLNDNYERQFNALFSQLKQHKENKQKQKEINNYNDKSIGLNIAFDNGHEQEFNV